MEVNNVSDGAVKTKTLLESAREFIARNRPEPAKCSTCGQPMPMFPTAGAHSLAYCPTTGRGHIYHVNIGGNPEEREAKRLTAFAAEREALARDEEREACAKIEYSSVGAIGRSSDFVAGHLEGWKEMKRAIRARKEG